MDIFSLFWRSDFYFHLELSKASLLFNGKRSVWYVYFFRLGKLRPESQIVWLFFTRTQFLMSRIHCYPLPNPFRGFKRLSKLLSERKKISSIHLGVYFDPCPKERQKCSKLFSFICPIFPILSLVSVQFHLTPIMLPIHCCTLYVSITLGRLSCKQSSCHGRIIAGY